MNPDDLAAFVRAVIAQDREHARTRKLLRDEIATLRADLSKGAPLDDALRWIVDRLNEPAQSAAPAAPPISFHDFEAKMANAAQRQQIFAATPPASPAAPAPSGVPTHEQNLLYWANNVDPSGPMAADLRSAATALAEARAEGARLRDALEDLLQICAFTTFDNDGHVIDRARAALAAKKGDT